MRKGILKHLWEGHLAISPWEYVKHIQGLWISPLATIYQMVINPIFIYDFSWRRLNEKVSLAVLKEPMRFSQDLHHLLDCILAADHILGLNFLSKFNLADAYMGIWV